MTQRQITHPTGTLPACANGHAAHHIFDLRSATAGGGHSLECECRRTARHPDLDLALVEWMRMNKLRRKRKPKPAKGSKEKRDGAKPRKRKGDGTVLQFPLQLG